MASTLAPVGAAAGCGVGAGVDVKGVVALEVLAVDVVGVVVGFDALWRAGVAFGFTFAVDLTLIAAAVCADLAGMRVAVVSAFAGLGPVAGDGFEEPQPATETTSTISIPKRLTET